MPRSLSLRSRSFWCCWAERSRAFSIRRGRALTDRDGATAGSCARAIARFDRFMGSITANPSTVYKQNLQLKEECRHYASGGNVAIVLQGRVNRYQSLLHAVPDPKLNSVLARVIGRASRPFLQTMILDAGKRHKVMPGQAVVDARGMIGRIYLTGQRTSWGDPADRSELARSRHHRVRGRPGRRPGDDDAATTPRNRSLAWYRASRICAPATRW